MMSPDPGGRRSASSLAELRSAFELLVPGRPGVIDGTQPMTFYCVSCTDEKKANELLVNSRISEVSLSR